MLPPFQPPLPVANCEEAVTVATVNDPDTLQHAANTLYSSGVVAWHNAIDKEQTAVLCQAARSNFADVRQRLLVVEAMGRTAEGDKVDSFALGGFHEVVARDGGRDDMRHRMDEEPFKDHRLLYNESWFPLVQEVLGDEICLLYSGIMIAAGTKTNDERRATVTSHNVDLFCFLLLLICALCFVWPGDHLVEGSHQPPHCLNVFIPLVDLTPENGPTEFTPGSHILGRMPRGRRIDTCDTPHRLPFTLTLTRSLTRSPLRRSGGISYCCLRPFRWRSDIRLPHSAQRRRQYNHR